MAYRFGLSGADVIVDAAGNAVTSTTAVTLHATEADATGNVNVLATPAVTGGRWSYTHATLQRLWLRTSDGKVWAADSVDATAPVFLSSSFYAEKYKTGGATDLAAIQAACAAATAAGPANLVRLSARTWDVGGGLSMSGYSCGLVGEGAGFSGTPAGTVLYASTQAGAVLDLTGWVDPDSVRGRVEFGGFALRGSGVADTTKAKIGLRRATTGVGSLYVHDIVISNTGGPCVDVLAVYLSDFARVTAVTPVGAKANDVPYMIFRACNGNRYDGLGFRSVTADSDTGVSGALVMLPAGGYAPEINMLTAPWFEYLHVPTGGCLISHAGNNTIIDSPQFFDCSKEAGATGTAFARLLVPTGTGVANAGGNVWRGYVPGKGTGATALDLGIDVQQSRNRITGIKGYSGTNVQLAAGVGSTYAELGGSESSASLPAFVDNSADTTTNTLIDHTTMTARHGAWAVDNPAGGGVRVYDPGAVGNGKLLLGQSGVQVSALNTATYLNADVCFFRDVAQSAGKLFQLVLNYEPGLIFPDHGGLPAATSGLRGKVAYVQGAAGVADKLYVCGKTAADTYAWTVVTTVA